MRRISSSFHCTLAGVSLLLTLLATSAFGAAAEQTLRVGTSGDYAPFSLASATAGPVGLDIDLANRLGRDLGLNVEFVRFAWPDLSARLQEGAFDVIMSGVTMREDRAVVGRYTRPYATTGAIVLVRASEATRFDGPSALNRPDVRVVVNAGGHLERVARERFPLAAIETLRDNTSLADRVLQGTADAALTDSAEAGAWRPPELHAIGPLTHDHKAFLLPPGAAELAARIDAWMVAREDDGWLKERRVRWLGVEGTMAVPQMAWHAIAALIRLRLSLMPAVAGAKRAAGLPIEDPDQEARVLSRVAAAAAPHSEAVLRVYRVLIEMAKVVQRASEPGSPSNPLAAVRDAVARIDEQLIREIRRRPAATTGEWLAVLEQDLSPTGIDLGAMRDLAGELAVAVE